MRQHEYSGKEAAMFRALRPELQFSMLPPSVVYSSLTNEVFVRSLRGPAVESLRRCMIALQDPTTYRLTPEFDALIQLESVEIEGRQWIGVYVDNDEDAKLVLDALTGLKRGYPVKHLGCSNYWPAIPSLDWDEFEPVSPEDESWRAQKSAIPEFVKNHIRESKRDVSGALRRKDDL